jgi:hypothetical protein
MELLHGFIIKPRINFPHEMDALGWSRPEEGLEGPIFIVLVIVADSEGTILCKYSIAHLPECLFPT